MSHQFAQLKEIDSLGKLLPAFEFDCLIARGGMGSVYKARQRSLDRDVAIKILPREMGDDPLFRSSFEAEAKAMARLTHPNLIKVFDSGDLNGLLFIVMEYVPGKSLFHSAHGKAIDPKQSAEIIIAACRGLAHAHENGIIHRDIKPANILLTPKRQPKIGDFGISRCSRTNADGLSMGTREYMAPEVINQPTKGDPQSDVYAIGMVLRELLTGVPSVNQHATKPVVSDPSLAAICRNATHTDTGRRYPDASMLAEDLTRWVASKPAAISRAHVIQRPSLANQQRPLLAKQRPLAPVLVRQGIPVTRVSNSNRAQWKNLAMITFLICSCTLTWHVYQNRSQAIAQQEQQQQREKNSNSPFRSAKNQSKPQVRIAGSRDRMSVASGKIQDSSSETLGGLGAALAAGSTE